MGARGRAAYSLSVGQIGPMHNMVVNLPREIGPIPPRLPGPEGGSEKRPVGDTGPFFRARVGYTLRLATNLRVFAMYG